MELFERLNELARNVGSKTKISQNLGITPQKYAGWSNTYSQRNFWELLPNLLAAMPDLSREWLYFEEGEMFRRGDHAPQNATPDREAIMQNYIETIRTLTETNRRLTEELLALRSGSK